MIVVSGGSGFLGQSVIPLLAQEKLATTGIYFSHPPGENDLYPNVATVKCDLREALLPGANGLPQKAEVIIHLAGETHAKSIAEFKEGNIVATKNICTYAKAVGAKCIIFTSSAIIDSKIPGPYRDTKLEAERIVLSCGLPAIIFRCSLLYGPGDRKNLFGMLKALRKLPIVPLFGNGRALVQPLHVEDAASAIVSAALQLGPSGTYYLAGPEPITFRTMVEALGNAAGVSPRYFSLPTFFHRAGMLFLQLAGSVVPGISVEQIARLCEDKSYDISDASEQFDFSPRPFERAIMQLFN